MYLIVVYKSYFSVIIFNLYLKTKEMSECYSRAIERYNTDIIGYPILSSSFLHDGTISEVFQYVSPTTSL